jgi:hypothetical protein
MSGGTFDYKEYQLKQLAEEILSEAKNLRDEENLELKQKAIEKMQKLAKKLKKIYKEIENLDYWLAGDSGIERYIK